MQTQITQSHCFNLRIESLVIESEVLTNSPEPYARFQSQN